MQVREFSYEDICELQQMANIIRKQIGLSNLMSIGAREYKFLENGSNGISFKVNSPTKRESIEVILNGDDTYSINHYKLKRVTNEKIYLNQVRGVYCDQIGGIIYHMINK
jgi:hypothetical protein